MLKYGELNVNNNSNSRTLLPRNLNYQQDNNKTSVSSSDVLNSNDIGSFSKLYVDVINKKSSKLDSINIGNNLIISNTDNPLLNIKLDNITSSIQFNTNLNIGNTNTNYISVNNNNMTLENISKIKLVDASINLIETVIGMNTIKKEYYISQIDSSANINNINFQIDNFCDISNSNILFTFNANISDVSNGLTYVLKQENSYINNMLDMLPIYSKLVFSENFDISFDIQNNNLLWHYNCIDTTQKYNVISKIIITVLIN